MTPGQCEKPYPWTPYNVQKELRGTHSPGDPMKGQVGEFLREEIGLEECIGNGHGKEGNIKELCLGEKTSSESSEVRLKFVSHDGKWEWEWQMRLKT